MEDRVIANLSRDKNKCSIFTEGIDGHCLNSYYYFKDKIVRAINKIEAVEKFKLHYNINVEIEEITNDFNKHLNNQKK